MLTSDADAGGNARLPSAVIAPGDGRLDCAIAVLTEQVHGTLVGETSTGGRLTAEAPMLWDEGMCAVAQTACRGCSGFG